MNKSQAEFNHSIVVKMFNMCRTKTFKSQGGDMSKDEEDNFKNCVKKFYKSVAATEKAFETFN
jgi:hypothetical protein